MVRTNLGVGILFFRPDVKWWSALTELPLHLKFSDTRLSDTKFSDTRRGERRRKSKKGGNTHRKQIVSPERSEQEKSHEVKLRSVSRAFSSHNPWENEKKALHTTACAATAQSKAQIPFWREHNAVRTVQTRILQAFGHADQPTAPLSIQWGEDLAERERIVLIDGGDKERKTHVALCSHCPDDSTGRAGRESAESGKKHLLQISLQQRTQQYPSFWTSVKSLCKQGT